MPNVMVSSYLLCIKIPIVIAAAAVVTVVEAMFPVRFEHSLLHSLSSTFSILYDVFSLSLVDIIITIR